MPTNNTIRGRETRDQLITRLTQEVTEAMREDLMRATPVIPVGEGLEAQLTEEARPWISLAENTVSNNFRELWNISEESIEQVDPTPEVTREIGIPFDGTSRRSFNLTGTISQSTFTRQIDPYHTYNGKSSDKPAKTYEPDEKVSLRNGNKAKYKDVVLVGLYFHLATDPDIALDYYKEDTYCLKRESQMIYTSFSSDGFINKKDVSWYQEDKYRYESNKPIVEINDGKNHVTTDYDAIPKEFYVECIKTNVFYHRLIAGNNAITQKQLKIKARKATCTYKPSFEKSNLKKDYAMGVISPSFTKTEGKRYTFGIELETISGILPKYVDSYLNYLSIRDGSLKDEDGNEYGFEYVTGVLTGDTGLLQTKRLCTELTKRCIVDKKCGIHVHLGGVDFSSELVVYLYKLHLMLENQIFDMMPLSRRNNEYCKRLKPFNFTFTKEDLNNPNKYKALIQTYYNQIYGYVSATSELPSGKANKKTQHPLGAKCGYNHNTARYCWINFVPTIFDTRENGHLTIENRIHPGSTNFVKIKNWVLINMGILWFAENHKQTIALNSEISLQHIMELAYPKQHVELNDYITIRSSKFASKDATTNKRNELLDYTEAVYDEDLSIKNL